MYRAIEIARHIIEYSYKEHTSISNLKLQKILYFIQAEFLISKAEPCFFDNIEAWDFGPVVPSVYHEFKKYGSYSIPDFEGKELAFSKPEDREIVEAVVYHCMKFSASQLVSLTHSQDPWIHSYSEGKHNCVITNDSILTYFQKAAL